jgi:TatD DNase family protein
MIDTHAHLYDAHFLNDIDAHIAEIRANGVQEVWMPNCDSASWKDLINVTNKYPDFALPMIGLHPTYVKENYLIELENLKNILNTQKVLAIGEIGLDYHYNNSVPEVQRKVFETQLQLACELDLPVVIHTREAEDDTKAILKNFSSSLKKKGVIHSFTSSPDLAEFVLSEGFYIGFNGIITFKKAENVQDVVKITPIERILFETDSPFLTPVPHRGKENAPYYLPFVAAKIAELKALDLEQLKDQVLKNSLQCFPKLA